MAFRQIGDEQLLVPIRTDPSQEMAVFRLNEVGAFLWQALGEPMTLESLGSRLAAEFEIGAKQAVADVRPFIEQLLGKQLIDRVE